MQTNVSPHNESSGYESKPACIVLRNGETFDVAHHDRTENDRWVFAYETERDGGIDYWFPSSSVLYIDTTSDATESHDEEDRELVADGGRPAASEVARRLVARSQYVESEDVTVDAGTVEVTVIERTLTIDATRVRVSDAVHHLDRAVTYAVWDQYPEDGGDDE